MKKLFSIFIILSAFATQLQASERPNILFIFADDWGWGDLSCHGHPYVKTPNIDRLAKEGTDFHRFTVASGVCSPSRTAVMTGHFPARYSINGHFAYVPSNARRNMPDWLSKEAPLLPRILQKSGYATAHFGKWHLANDMIPDSPVPGEYGYDTYGAYNCSGEQMPYHEDAQHTIDFIEKSHEQKKPFFINLWIHEPHTPFHTLPKYRWRFRHLENDADNIYASVLSHADDRIGQILDTLDKLNIADNTMVVFSSDNGPARASKPTGLTLMHDTATGAGWEIGAAKGITGGRKGYKGAIFEGGIGVPFIVRWPGKVKAGKVDKNSFVSAVDLLPTFCEAAGVKLPDGYQPDGISQIKTFMGQSSSKREKPLFWKHESPYPAPKAKPHHWVSYAIVHQEWKLLSNGRGDYQELYNIAADPLEQNDLKEENPKVVQKLLSQIEQWKATLPKKPSGDVFSNLRKGQTQKSSTAEKKAINLLTSKELSLNSRWTLKDGLLYPSEKPGGILWSKGKYSNFELTVEYKTSEKCNSGVFFRTNPKNAVQEGFEIQVASAGLYSGKHVVGSLYDAKEPTSIAVKPDGEWNTMVLICKGPKISVVLNGQKIQNVNIDNWTTANKNPDGTKNKFKTALKDLPRTGHIGVQYHGQPVWYRKLSVKVLD